MNIGVSLDLWQVVIAFAIVVSGYAVNTYKTHQNSKNIEVLNEKCDEMMNRKEAKETFVSIELYRNEVNHLNNTLGKVESQISEVLRILTKK